MIEFRVLEIGKGDFMVAKVILLAMFLLNFVEILTIQCNLKDDTPLQLGYSLIEVEAEAETIVLLARRRSC